MTETTNRVLVAGGLILGLLGAIWLQNHGFPSATYWLELLVCAGMIFEFLSCLWSAPRDVMFNQKNLVLFLCFLGLLVLDFTSIMTVGHRPMVMLMILVIVCAADVGAWLFGRICGGDKLWEKVSEHKTWAGQIAGIICGAACAILYGHLFLNPFTPQMVWVGIGIALLSQYGDLTASFIKRKMKIKDFSNVLGNHGGIIDRFDGWIYALPVMWYVLM